MFFYLYMIVELLGIFLDSGIIPSSSNVYAVSNCSRVERITSRRRELTHFCPRLPPVVRCDPPRRHLCDVLVSPREWFRRVPIIRRRNSAVPLGAFPCQQLHCARDEASGS